MGRVNEGADPMRAQVLSAFGGPENFKLMDIPKPEAKPGMVLIRLVATSVNQIGTKISGGLPGVGGVGHIGIQLAKALGARGATAIPSAAVAGLARDLGADETTPGWLSLHARDGNGRSSVVRVRQGHRQGSHRYR
jgi:NADPH:quinone reductase-like Zn-dependent oxidoreductase